MQIETKTYIPTFILISSIKLQLITKPIFQKPMLIFTHLLTLGNVSTNAAQTLDARNFHDSIFKFDGSLKNETLHDVWCISLAVFTDLHEYNFSAGSLSIQYSRILRLPSNLVRSQCNVFIFHRLH